MPVKIIPKEHLLHLPQMLINPITLLPAATPAPVSNKPPLLLDKNSGFDVANLDKDAYPLEAYDNILEKTFTKNDEELAKRKKPGWWERTKNSFEGRTADQVAEDPDACKTPILESEKVEKSLTF